MTQPHATTETLIAVAAGRIAPDLVYRQANVVNVFTREIVRADVAVSGGRIAGVGAYRGPQEIDCTNLYLCPGFIDAHCHIESSMAAPAEFCRAVLPSGTTALIADPHEIVNVCGAAGLRFMLEQAAKAVCDLYFMLPSCVPATQWETAGAVFSAQDMKSFLRHSHVLGLAEVMNVPGVVGCDPGVMEKIKLFSKRRIDGHAPGLSGHELQAYAAAGISTDHEAVGFAEVLEKARAGISVLVREGSAAHNLTAILTGVLESKIPTNRMLFCTDDKHLDDVRRDGHIVHNIRMAIALGIQPVEAICMATLNTAEHYGLLERGAIAPGRLADLVLISDLQAMRIEAIYKAGVSSNVLLSKQEPTFAVLKDILHSVHAKEILPGDLRLPVSGVTDVLEMVPSQLLTRHLREEVPANQGLFQPNSLYTKLCVVERHGKNGNIAVAPLKGYGITGGAIATSVAHDSHNIIAAGDNDRDLALAINCIRELNGGYAVVQNGQVTGSLPLAIAGLMSAAPYAVIEQETKDILKQAGCLRISAGIEPFISLSFLALPVIPTLRLTDKGLIDLFQGL